MRPALLALIAASLCALATPAPAAVAAAPKGKSAKKKPEQKKPAAAPAPEQPAEVEQAEGAATAPAAAPATAAPAAPAASTDTAAQPRPPPGAAPAPAAGGDKEEVVTDFDAEEKQLDRRIEKEVGPVAKGEAPGAPGRSGDLFGGAVGVKLVVDLLLQYQVGSKNISFFPNHNLVIVMLNVTDRFSAQIHIAEDPAFYELAFAVTPSLTIKAGKLLVPFGTNNFHHIIGGRVDQQSHFLPETWGDYGLGVNHLLLDFKYFSLEYDLYVVNGFGGTTEPVVATGALVDNNFGKGIGGRITVGLPFGIRLVGSVYHSLWSPENDRGALYYALGGVLPMGAIKLPVLDRLGLRGEWGRGELQHLEDNVQQGITKYAVAKAGWYGEGTFRIIDLLSVRLRFGRINPDNSVRDADDVELIEPAIVFGTPKLSVLAAWQFTWTTGRPYSLTAPADVIYAKLFVQY